MAPAVLSLGLLGVKPAFERFLPDAAVPRALVLTGVGAVVLGGAVVAGFRCRELGVVLV